MKTMTDDIEKPLISIIVPVYNVEKYLRQCLDSILKQTYENLEVILVDDGSKDGSGIICEEYAEKYENFTVIHKQNAGLGMARNTGLEHISGEYVTFLDSDDWIEPDMIQRLYESLIENRVDMCKAGFRRVTDERKVLFSRTYENACYPGERARLELLPRMVGSSPSRHDSVEMCVCGVLYQASIIREHRLRFPSERELISEDLVFNIDYMQHANGACTIEYSGYNYRMNPRSLTTKYRPDRFEASCHFYLEMKKKLVELGYGEDTLLRLSRMFFIYVRTSIAQERLAISGLKRSEALANIRRICTSLVLTRTIAEYPIGQLGYKQALFLNLLKGNYVKLIYLIVCIGLI